MQGDGDEILLKYMTWQINRNKGQQTTITKAYQTLAAQLYSINQIHGFKKSD